MSSSDSSSHVGPVIFADKIARRQLEQHGDVVTFRTSKRTTGDTWWRKSRTGPKMGNCTIEYIGPADPSSKSELKPHRSESGFRKVSDWQDAISTLNNSLSEGHLYRVTSDELWAECESCHEYSTDVEAVGDQIQFTYLCPDCRSE